MVRIKPFCGIRPPKEYAAEVASRPYDVLNSVEAKAEATERSLLHIIKPEIDFEPMNTPSRFTIKLWRISKSGSLVVGLCRTSRNTTISMRRL